jgi:hypothetical protein
MQLSEALRLAMKRGSTSPRSTRPHRLPECKLLDFAKYEYEERRKPAMSRQHAGAGMILWRGSGLDELRPVCEAWAEHDPARSGRRAS